MLSEEIRGHAEDVPEEAGDHIRAFIDALVTEGLAGFDSSDFGPDTAGRPQKAFPPGYVSEVKPFTYEPPKLVDFREGQVAYGDCSYTGSSAGGTCTTNGNNATAICSSNGNNGTVPCPGCCDGNCDTAYYGCSYGSCNNSGCCVGSGESQLCYCGHTAERGDHCWNHGNCYSCGSSGD
jgi:hypothetical protein